MKVSFNSCLYNRNKINFGQLIYDQSMFSKLPPDVVNEIPRVEEELANTKHWDLVLRPEKHDTSFCEYVNKHNPQVVYAYGFEEPELKGKTVSADGVYLKKKDGIRSGDFISFVDLKFATEEQAKDALNVIKSYDIKSLTSEANIVKMLDSAQEIILDDTDYLSQS